MAAVQSAISDAFQRLLESDGVPITGITGAVGGGAAHCHLHVHLNDNDGDDDESTDSSSAIGAGGGGGGGGTSSSELARQGYLCSVLAQALVNANNGNANVTSDTSSSSKASLRDILGDQASALGPLVGPLLQNRVDRQDLMPATQDVEANEEVLLDAMAAASASATATTHKNAQTLTLPAVQAAWLYAKALSLPGALGSGLVDLEWLTALTALVRRWSLECCGREDDLVVWRVESSSTTTSSTSITAKSPSKSPPKKRTRRNDQASPPSPDDHEDEEELDEDDMLVDDADQDTNNKNNKILQIGLQVALAVCAIPHQREFAAWSFEAREAVLEAVCASFGTAAALQSKFQHEHDDHEEDQDNDTQQQQHIGCCSNIVQQASKALQASLAHYHHSNHGNSKSSSNSNNGSSNSSSSTNTTRQHETAVLACRGLLHLLQFKEILPNGEKGKLDAQKAAAEALQDLMEGFHRASLSESSSRGAGGRRSSLGDATNQQTPSRGGRGRRRSTGGLLMTPATTTAKNGKTPRRRRSSVEIPGTDGGLTLISSPALKGRRSSLGGSLGGGGVGGVTPLAGGSLSSKPRPVWSVFVGLLQKLATTQGLERASARGPTVDALVHCVPALPLVERAHFLRYLLKLAKSKVSLHRLLACELLGRILAQDWLSAHHEDTVVVLGGAADGSTNYAAGGGGGANTPAAPETPMSAGSNEDGSTLLPLPVALWKALQGRLVDKLAAVRARAATSIETATSAHPDWLDETLLFSLRKRALRDETATVRKAAVLALKQVLLAQQGDLMLLSEIYIATFCELCQDSSLLTRKAAAESITQLLEAYLNHPTVGSLLEQAWSTCVLPMVLDEDVSSKAIGSLDQVVVTPLLLSMNENDGDHTMSAAKTAAAWRLLAHVANSCSSQGASKGARQALQTALRQMALNDSDRIHKQLWKQSAIVAQESLQDPETSEAQVVGVWCLLEALLLSASSSSKQVKTMVQTLQKNSKRSSSSCVGLEALCGSSWKILLLRCGKTSSASASSSWLRGTLRSCLCVVSKLAPGLDEESAQNIHADLRDEVCKLSFPPEVIGGAISALTSVSMRLDPANARTLCSQWIRLAYTACEEEMATSVKYGGGDDMAFTPDRQQRLVRALFCVGELSMVGFRVDDDEKDSSQQKKNNDDAANQLRGMHETPSKRLQELVQSLLPPTLPGSSSVTETPTTIRAHAFTVLGKLCLRDEALAKNSLNIFARELHPSAPNPSPAVQSNALLVLGDLCVRYTNMADRYLPVMASCLQSGTSDPETNLLQSNTNAGFAITRKHAVLLLSSLLLQDYIKWRGLLFHRFLVACSDENEEVAALAESVLSGPLSTRNPKLFFNHFVEALFVLNKCTAHPIYVAAASQGDGGSGIAVGFEGIYLNGELGRLRRRRMYDFLLSKLSDEEKIGVTARLAKEVLGEAVSNEGDLGRVCQMKTGNQDFGPKLQSAWNVLVDAFSILTSKSIKVGSKMNQEEQDYMMEDPNVPNPTRQVSIAKNRLLSKISRKHLIEIVLPILCNLKTKLQASCSPLLKELMTYLLDIFKSYKMEVKEYLANDPTLLQEIEYDARQYAMANNNNATSRNNDDDA